MSDKFIAVNNDHGWGKGKTSDDARARSLVEGRKATLVRIWETTSPEAYVDGMGVVYGIKRPNPSPRWFGFHEIFHACTVAAFVVHYIAVSFAVYSHGS